MIALQHCVGLCRTSTRVSHRYTYILSLLNLASPAHLFAPLWVVVEHHLRSLSRTASSHWLSVFRVVTCVFPCPSLHLPRPLPPPLCSRVWSVSASLAALQIGSSASSFWTPSTCADTRHLFFSFWLPVWQALASSTSLELTQTHSRNWSCSVVFDSLPPHGL